MNSTATNELPAVQRTRTMREERPDLDWDVFEAKAGAAHPVGSNAYWNYVLAQAIAAAQRQQTEEWHRAIIAEEVEKLRTKTGMKLRAQEILMHGIAVAQGYWHEQEKYVYEALSNDEARAEFSRVLHQQADRVARLFGYEESWPA